jgi:hypothetical protein
LTAARFWTASLGEWVLFSAETSDGKLLPAETAQKLMQLPASQCQQQSVVSISRIEDALNAAPTLAEDLFTVCWRL